MLQAGMDALVHVTSEIASGSKLGLDATKKILGEGFKRPWPPLIRMDAAVKAKVEKFSKESHEPATLAANNPKPTRYRAASANPKGIASSSPRLRGTSYLGSRSAMETNPNGVVSLGYAKLKVSRP